MAQINGALMSTGPTNKRRKLHLRPPRRLTQNEEHAAKKTKVSPGAKVKASESGSGANSKLQRPEDVASTTSGMFRTLVSSKLLEPVLAPYCTTRMLAFLSMTCRWLEAPVLLVLTTRKEWPLSAVDQWTQSRLAYVHHLLYDSFTIRMAGSLPRGLTGLTHLTFCNGFNQPVAAGVLPAGLTQLSFGLGFNQPVAAGVLPAGLTHLTFSYDFNQPVAAGVLPVGLAQLDVSRAAFARIAGIPSSCSVHFVGAQQARLKSPNSS